MAAWKRAASAPRTGRGGATRVLKNLWIERGESRTWIVNSLGCDATFDFAGGGAGLEAVVDSSTMRYEISLDSGDPDPQDFAMAAALEAAGLQSGGSIVPGEFPVVLSPRAAAVWLRWVAPWFRGGDKDDVTRGGSGDPLDPELPRRPWFHIVDEATGEGSMRLDGEGRCVGARTYLRQGQLADRIVDSRDPTAPAEDLGPMRRDSFRDRPSPGALSLAIPAGGGQGGPLFRDIARGVQILSLTPRIAAGGDIFLAEVRGHWIERGSLVHPIPPTLMKIDRCGGLALVAATGTDAASGPPGLPTLTPSLLFERAELIPL